MICSWTFHLFSPNPHPEPPTLITPIPHQRTGEAWQRRPWKRFLCATCIISCGATLLATLFINQLSNHSSPSSFAWRPVTSVGRKSEITNKQIVEPIQPPTSLNRSQFRIELKSKYRTCGKITSVHLMWLVLLTIFLFWQRKHVHSPLFNIFNNFTIIVSELQMFSSDRWVEVMALFLWQVERLREFPSQKILRGRKLIIVSYLQHLHIVKNFVICFGYLFCYFPEQGIQLEEISQFPTFLYCV